MTVVVLGMRRMIKLVYCVRRRADLPEETFRRYWLEQHGPLVRSVASTVGAKKYVQSHTVAPEINAQIAELRDLPPAYDGIAEVWWDDLESFRAGFNSPSGQEARRRLIQDEAKFIDFSQSRVFLTEEHVILDL